MSICILMGSPRKNGNTSQLLRPFMEAMEAENMDCKLIWLYDKHIRPCASVKETGPFSDVRSSRVKAS